MAAAKKCRSVRSTKRLCQQFHTSDVISYLFSWSAFLTSHLQRSSKQSLIPTQILLKYFSDVSLTKKKNQNDNFSAVVTTTKTRTITSLMSHLQQKLEQIAQSDSKGKWLLYDVDNYASCFQSWFVSFPYGSRVGLTPWKTHTKPSKGMHMHAHSGTPFSATKAMSTSL